MVNFISYLFDLLIVKKFQKTNLQPIRFPDHIGWKAYQDSVYYCTKYQRRPIRSWQC